MFHFRNFQFPASNSEFIKQTLMYYYVHYVQNLERNFFSRFSGKKVFFPENLEQKLFVPDLVHNVHNSTLVSAQ